MKNGQCPIEDFLDSLSDKVVTKILWVLRLIKQLDIVPKIYFKKLVDTNGIWEVRIQLGSNIYRLLGFFYKNNVLILSHGFKKKDQKTPRTEIDRAEKNKKNYIRRYCNG